MKLPISVCMIVRDEEANLPRALDSVIPYVEEIIVLDTGSTDRTVEIAEERGATVGHYIWHDNFAMARNISLKMAHQPWIMILDADEDFDSVSLPAVAEAVKSDALCWLLHVHLMDETGKYHDEPLPRLFRRHPKLVFERALHESILEPLRRLSDRPPRLCGGVIRHHGYNRDTVISRGKIERNLRIHRQMRAEGKADAYCLYKQAQLLLLPGEEEERSSVCREAWEMVLAAAPNVRSEWPWLRRFQALFGRVLCRERRFREAHEVLSAWGGWNLLEPVDLVMAHLDYVWSSGKGTAQECQRFMMALPSTPPANAMRARIAETFGDAAELQRLAQNGCLEAVVWLALLLLGTGRESEALQYLSAPLREHPEDPVVRYASGIVLARHGEFNGALQIFSEIKGDYAALAADWIGTVQERLKESR